MGITSVKNNLMKQRIFKSNCLKMAQQYDTQQSATVELRKDIDSLDFAIRILGKIERSKKQ